MATAIEDLPSVSGPLYSHRVRLDDGTTATVLGVFSTPQTICPEGCGPVAWERLTVPGVKGVGWYCPRCRARSGR